MRVGKLPGPKGYFVTGLPNLALLHQETKDDPMVFFAKGRNLPKVDYERRPKLTDRSVVRFSLQIAQNPRVSLLRGVLWEFGGPSTEPTPPNGLTEVLRS
jgi:hypothetical protein